MVCFYLLTKTMKKKSSLEGKTILLVNTGSLKKKFILTQLAKLDSKLIILNKEKNWGEQYADHWILADTNDHVESIEAVKAFLTQHPKIKIDGVLTFWEDDVLLASKIVDHFHFIGIPFKIARQTRNKFLMREFCAKNGLPTVRHSLIRSLKDVDRVAKSFKFPLVVKPAYGSSSAYVIKVEDKDQLKQTYTYIAEQLSTETESALADGFDVYAEEYIDGEEVDLDILIQNGKVKFYSISDNGKTAEPFFLETSYSLPSNLPEEDQNDLIEMAEETLERLGIQNGCIHFEAKISSLGPVPIEVNLRMGGDEIYSSVKNVWGVDLIEQAVNIAVGNYIKIKKPAEPKVYVEGLSLVAEHSGIMTQLEIDEEIEEKDYLKELHFFKKVGDPVLVPPEGYDFTGWLTVCGDNTRDAKENLAEVLDHLHYTVAKYTPASSIGRSARKTHLSFASLKKDILEKAAKIEKLKTLPLADLKKLNLGILANLKKKSGSLVPSPEAFEAEKISKLLRSRNYNVTVFNINNFPQVINQIKKNNINLVLNLARSAKDLPFMKLQAAAVLDLIETPHTGPSAAIIGLCTDILKMRKILSYHDIPTPEWEFIYDQNDLYDLDLSYPLTVRAVTNRKVTNGKPVIIAEEKDLVRQVREVTENFKYPGFIEEHIEGKHYLIPVLGNTHEDLQALPISLLKKRKDVPLKENGFSSGQFCSANGCDSSTFTISPRNIETKLSSLMTEIALDAYTIVGGNDFGLVEIAVDEDKNPFVLNIDPAPEIIANLGIAKVAAYSGMELGDFVESILDTSFKRYKQKPTPFYL